MLGCEVTHNSEVLLMYDFMLIIGYRFYMQTNELIYIYIFCLYIMYSNVPLISIVRYTWGSTLSKWSNLAGSQSRRAGAGTSLPVAGPGRSRGAWHVLNRRAVDKCGGKDAVGKAFFAFKIIFFWWQANASSLPKSLLLWTMFEHSTLRNQEVHIAERLGCLKIIRVVPLPWGFS